MTAQDCAHPKLVRSRFPYYDYCPACKYFVPIKRTRPDGGAVTTPEFLSPDEIAQIEFDHLKTDQEEVQLAREMTDDQLYSLHHGYGTYIRNTYHLWHEDNPHTGQLWAKERATHIRDGTDHSPHHPDSVSMEIILKIHAKLKELP